MKRPMKTVAVALAAVLSLCACSAPKSDSSAPASSATPSAVSSAPKSMYPVAGNPKITLVRALDAAPLSQAGLKSYAEAAGFKAWQKQTGISVEIKEPADNPALLLLLASGDIPDIVLGNKNFYTGGNLKMAQDGYAIDLKAKMADWGPDYAKHLNSNAIYLNSVTEADGSIRAFAGYSFEMNSPYRSWRGLMVRKEFMDKLGMKSIETVDEFYTFLSRCKKELNTPLPWANDKNNFNQSSFFNEGAITSGFGLVNSGEYIKDRKYHFGAYEPEYKDFLSYLNKLYTEKLLDNNFAVTDEATAQSSVIKGETAAIYAAASRIQVMSKTANSPDFNLVGLASLVKNKGDKPMFGQADPYVSTAYWAFITEKSKNREAAMKFCNYLFTEPGTMLYNFGTEGVSYTMVNGKPAFTDLVTKNPNNYALDPMIRTQALMNWFGIMRTEMSEQRFPMQAQRDAYAAWARNDVDKYKLINNSIMPEMVNENATLYADIDTYINEMRAKFISGAEPLSRFDNYIATLKKMGMDRLIEIRQKSYEAYNK